MLTHLTASMRSVLPLCVGFAVLLGCDTTRAESRETTPSVRPTRSDKIQFGMTLADATKYFGSAPHYSCAIDKGVVACWFHGHHAWSIVEPPDVTGLPTRIKRLDEIPDFYDCHQLLFNQRGELAASVWIGEGSIETVIDVPPGGWRGRDDLGGLDPTFVRQLIDG